MQLVQNDRFAISKTLVDIIPIAQVIKLTFNQGLWFDHRERGSSGLSRRSALGIIEKFTLVPYWMEMFRWQCLDVTKAQTYSDSGEYKLQEQAENKAA